MSASSCLTETPQIDRAAVEQETPVPDLKGADADPVQILVHHRAALVDADDQIVEIGGVDIPQFGVLTTSVPVVPELSATRVVPS